MIVDTDTLDSMCELVIDCPHFTPKWTDSGYIVLRNQNIKNGVLNLSSPSFTHSEDFQRRNKRATPKAGDIVFTREAPMGEVCIIPEGLECCLGQRQVLLRPKNDVCGQYLFWALQSPFVQHQISWNEGTGSTVSNVRIPVLKVLNIPRHPKKEGKIAKRLSDLTDKIELNRQTNQTLEQMAQAVFKSWFVDFEPTRAKIKATQNGQDPTRAAMATIAGKTLDQLDTLSTEQIEALTATAVLFPDALIDSELSEIPEGWAVKNIGELGKVVTGKTPPKRISDAYCSEGVPFITPTDIDNSLFVTSTNRFLSDEGKASIAKTEIENGSICVTCIGSQMGKTIISPSKAFTNQQINTIILHEFHHRNYLLLNLRNRRDEILLIGSSGSTMPIINKSTFERLSVTIPSEPLIKRFDFFVMPLVNKIQEGMLENSKLNALRDTLLPKLLSGEIDVASLEGAEK